VNGAVAAARRRVRRVRTGDEAGATMAEVMVSVAIMSFVMAMFTTAIIQMMHSANRMQQMSGAQSDLNVAFLRLDKEIRYASAISKEGVVNGDPYIEYLATNTNSRVCSELRLHNRQLQWRTWVQPAPPTVPSATNVTPSPWHPIASNVVATPAALVPTPYPSSSPKPTAPFAFHDADDTYNFQRLELNIISGDTTPAPAASATKVGSRSRANHVVFTALNTSLVTKGHTTDCAEGRLIP
jgi:hypothetical protein